MTGNQRITIQTVDLFKMVYCGRRNRKNDTLTELNFASKTKHNKTDLKGKQQKNTMVGYSK